MDETITARDRTRGRNPWAKGFRRLVRWGAVSIVVLLAAVTAAAYVVVGTTSWDTVPAGLSFIHTGRYETRFAQFGPKRATTVVLIHGAFESVDTWRPVADLLASQFHVEAYDLAGYGYTERVGPYTTEGLATQLAAFLQARHISHPILVGHSLGAGVIAQYLLDHPHAARAVVFVDGDGLSLSIPGSHLLPLVVRDPYRTALYRGLLRSDWFLQQIWSATCGPHCPLLTEAQLNTIRRPLLIPGAMDALMDIATRPIVGVSPAQLRAVGTQGIPALVIFGSLDPEYPPGDARATAAALGAKDPTILVGASHESIWSDPQGVATAIENFVAHLR